MEDMLANVNVEWRDGFPLLTAHGAEELLDAAVRSWEGTATRAHVADAAGVFRAAGWEARLVLDGGWVQFEWRHGDFYARIPGVDGFGTSGHRRWDGLLAADAFVEEDSPLDRIEDVRVLARVPGAGAGSDVWDEVPRCSSGVAMAAVTSAACPQWLVEAEVDVTIEVVGTPGVGPYPGAEAYAYRFLVVAAACAALPDGAAEKVAAVDWLTSRLVAGNPSVSEHVRTAVSLAGEGRFS